jgi:hypothetical protein
MLKLRVPLAQLPELAQLAEAQFRILLFQMSNVAFLLPCSRQMSATLVPVSARRKARKVCSSECPFFTHRRVFLGLVHRTNKLAVPNSTYRWLAFRFLGHSFTCAVALYRELLPLR